MIGIAIIGTRMKIIATVRIERRLGSLSTTRLWLGFRLKLGKSLERMSIRSLRILLLLILTWEL
jgi:hypothetical protein